MNGDQYMDLLLERQAEHVRDHPPALESAWAVLPLLEWFIRPGDEDLFTPPAEAPQPKRVTTPRTYRSAASLREERDRLDAARRPLAEPLSPDTAASQGQALGRRRTMKLAQREDSRLRRYVALSNRITQLDHRIRLAEAREARR